MGCSLFLSIQLVSSAWANEPEAEPEGEGAPAPPGPVGGHPDSAWPDHGYVLDS
jgi:hypothetical protein